MRKLLSMCVVLFIVAACAVQPALAKGNPLTEEVKQKLYIWATANEAEPVAQDTFVFEDVTGAADQEDYRIYHVKSTEWAFLTEIGFARIGNSVVRFGSSDRGFAVCELKDGAAVGIYSVEEAYAAEVIDGAALDKMQDACGTVTVWRVGDINMDKAVNVADIMKVKNCIMDGWSDEELALADTDANGMLEVGDVLFIKNMIMQQA